MRFQKLMWRNMMKSTKSKKVSVLHYSIDDMCPNFCISFRLLFELLSIKSHNEDN
jgi:hypothetical protein